MFFECWIYAEPNHPALLNRPFQAGFESQDNVSQNVSFNVHQGLMKWERNNEIEKSYCRYCNAQFCPHSTYKHKYQWLILECYLISHLFHPFRWKTNKTVQTVSLLSSDQWGEYHFHTSAMISVSLLFLSSFLCLRHHHSFSLSPEQCMDYVSSELVDDSYFHLFCLFLKWIYNIHKEILNTTLCPLC